jgi:hypothetical protein
VKDNVMCTSMCFCAFMSALELTTVMLAYKHNDSCTALTRHYVMLLIYFLHRARAVILSHGLQNMHDISQLRFKHIIMSERKG